VSTTGNSSIPANLTEGGHRLSTKEFRQFVNISKGSVGELEYHLLLSKDLKYLLENEYNVLRVELEEMSKMLTGLIKSLS
jgi:four helix bundle protein